MIPTSNKKTLKYARWSVYLSVFIIVGSLLAGISSNSLAKPLAAADVTISVGVPTPVMIGDDFILTVGFENSGSDPGYGPFIDLVFPFTGQDGDDGINYNTGLGSTFLGASLEDDVQIFPDDGGGTGCVSHPWLRDASGDYVDVCGEAGDQFVSIRLPFGSYVPDQPRLDISVNAHLSNLADLSPDLIIYARGGYMFGDTPEDDWCCGDTPYGVPNGTDSTTWPDTPVTPQVMTFTKAYVGPSNNEDETATGPNFPRQYSLTVEIADNQTLTNIEIQDLLPDNVQFISIDPFNTTAGYTVTSLPSTTNPGGTLSLNYASGTGTIVVTYNFYIPQLFDLPNPPDDDALFDDPVIDPTSGDDVDSDNIAWVDASWDPFDGRDPISPVSSNFSCPTCLPLHTLEDKSIAIQKSVNVISGGVGPENDPAPGAVMEYTITFQISDYFSFENLVVTDLISDGQHVLPLTGPGSHVPELAVNGNPYSLVSGPMNGANFSISCDYSGATTTAPTECTVLTGPPPPAKTGETTLTFNVSNEIITRGQNGRMLGGCIDSTLGGIISPCDPGNLGDGSTTGTIVFRTMVLENFVDTYPSGDDSVDQGDEFYNDVVVVGDILDNNTWGVIGSEADDASAGASIGRETLAKSIYAINDVTNSALWDMDSLGRVRVNPGDKITYELEYGLLTSDVEELTFDDYFPLPVFDVLDPDANGTAGPAWSFSSAAGIPAPGVVGLRQPGDTFYNYMVAGLSGGTGTISASTHNPAALPDPQDPIITADGPNNKINIYYADFDDTRNQSTTVDLLISLIVSDDPFADGLFLTNMAHAFEGSTNAGTNTENAIVQFVLGEPVLVTTKGIVWSSNTGATVVFDPITTGPAGVTFEDSSFAPRWTGVPGVINSTGLASNPIDSNVSGVDAGDTLTFAIMIENQGTSINGAFDIMLRDILDTDYYQIPATGLNLQVYYGDGTGPIPYEAVDGSCVVDPAANNDACGEEIFEEGLELIDPIDVGVCSAYDANSGTNVILVTYDLELRDDIIPGQAINTVSVFNFAGTEDGPNHLEFVNPLEDDATADVIGDLEKTLENTEIIIPGLNELDEVVIGELVTYKLSAVVPEGDVPLARLVDHLDGGLAFVSCDSVDVIADTGVVTDLIPTDFSGVCAATEASVSSPGEDITFDLGNITNNDRDDNLERIEITYTVVVTNVVGSQNTLPTVLDNMADFLMNSGSGDVVLGSADADDVTVIEPRVITEKFTPAGSTSTAATGDAGDGISFTITISNPSTAADTIANDVIFIDDFPMCPNLADGSAIVGLAIDSQSGNADFVLTGSDAAGWQLSADSWDPGPGSMPINFSPGDSATVDVSGTIAYCVTPGYPVANTGTTTWTSLDHVFTGVPRSTYNIDSIERDGSDGVGGALNDYASEATATVTIDTPVNTKYLITTSEDHTEVVNGLENLAIGEVVRFRLISTIPEGTSPNYQVRDLLPNGLVFLNDGTSVVAFVSNSGITSTGLAGIPAVANICNQVGSTADASTPILDPVNCTLQDGNISADNLSNDDSFGTPGTDIFFKVGTLYNGEHDADIEYVVIEFNTFVHNNSISQNDANDTWNNQHQVYVNNIQNGNTSAPVTIRIAEPVIEVTKQVVGTPPADAGDPIEYQIVFSNSAVGDSSATVYDLQLTDTFDSYLENLSISSVTTSQGAACVGDGSGATVFSQTEVLAAGVLTVNLSCLDAGENTTINITGNVVDNVPASTTIVNSAIGIGTSLEGPAGTTGNSTGSDTPGSSGTDTGERDGSDTDTGGQDDYYDTGDADVDLTAPSIAKSVEAPGQWTIGETFTYDLIITLPEGVTPDMVVYDDIPVGLEFVSQNIITLASAAGSLLTEDFDGTLPSPVVTAAGGSGGDLELNFGDTTLGEEFPNNINNNRFQIQIEVRMLNVIDNQNGDTLINQGELRYSSGTTATGTVNVTVIEPVLTIDKTVDDDTPSLGQTITYTLEISHDLDGVPEDSTSDAFNVRVTDTLPTGLSNLTNITTSSTGGCAVGFNTGASTVTTLDVTINEIPFTLPSPGCVVTITFDATVDSPSPLPPPVVGRTIDNTANIIWTSTSIINPETREGDDVSGNVDDYETDGSQQVTITNPELSITKDDGTTVYVPGESVTYTIEVQNVGNIGVTGAVVTDSIPAEVLNWDWVCDGSTPPAVGCNGILGSTANFSDTINLAAGQTLTYYVTSNTDPGALSAMLNTVVVDMPAGIVEPTPSDNTASDTDTATPEADLRITKDDGVTIISPGVTLTYTVLVENTSPSNVIGATVEDLIPAEIDSWSWVCTAETGGASGCTPMGTSSVDFNDTVNLPALSSIEYTVTALVSTTASGTLTNTATVTSPAGVTERNLTDNTDDDVDSIATLAKTLDSQLHTTGNVPIIPDVAIGQILTYEVVLTMPVGTMDNTHLVDMLDRGLAYVSCESIVAPGITTTAAGGLSAVCANPTVSELPVGDIAAENQGRQIDFDFATLENLGPAAATLTLRYRVAVLDSLANQSGSTPLLVNDAELTWDSGTLDDQAVGVNILEPDMSLAKDAFPTTLYPGQLTTFTLTVEHTAGSQTSAFDVEVEDIIPADLIFQSAAHVGGQAPTAILTAGDPTIIIQWDEFLDDGTNSVIEIVVMLDPAYVRTKNTQVIVNDASLAWTSLPGDFSTPQSTHNTLSTERFYDPLSNINIYGIGDAATIRIPALPDTGFAPGVVTDLPLQKNEQAYGDLDGLRVEIPALGKSVPIVSVPLSDNGWDLTWLWNQAGWLEGTAYPSWYGNTVITGHAYLPSGLPGPFVDLDDLSWGDEIILYAHGLQYTYQVRFVDLVAADDFSILQHKDQDWLTLFTCKEYNDLLEGYLWRQAVQAVLIDVEEID